jgi:hypothetical protein
MSFVKNDQIEVNESFIAELRARPANATDRHAIRTLEQLLGAGTLTVNRVGMINLSSKVYFFIRVIPNDQFAVGSRDGTGTIVYFNTASDRMNAFSYGTALFPNSSNEVIQVWNGSGVAITRGAAVYHTGFSTAQGLPMVALASAASTTTSMVLGVAAGAISNGAAGQVIIEGDFSTLNTSMYAINDLVFLSDTPGVLSTSVGTETAVVGKVTAVSATQGTIYIFGFGGGIQGETGVQGVTGLQGETGIKGCTGIQGNTGIKGCTGVQGIQGNTGVQGIQGNTGTQGIQGIQGNTGTQGIQGIQGNTGTQGIQGNTGASIQGNTGLAVSDAGLQIATITLSSAQILALNTTPITLVAAQGASTYVVIEEITALNDYGTTTYAFSGDMSIRYTNGAGAETVTAFPEVAFCEAASDAVSTRHGVDVVPVVNAPVVAFAEGGNPITGDGEFDLNILYRVVTLTT